MQLTVLIPVKRWGSVIMWYALKALPTALPGGTAGYKNISGVHCKTDQPEKESILRKA
jgi:hypothetical protein